MKYCPNDGFKFVGKYCSVCGKSIEILEKEIANPPKKWDDNYEEWYRNT